jgi:hypothetical protein
MKVSVRTEYSICYWLRLHCHNATPLSYFGENRQDIDAIMGHTLISQPFWALNPNVFVVVIAACWTTCQCTSKWYFRSNKSDLTDQIEISDQIGQFRLGLNLGDIVGSVVSRSTALQPLSTTTEWPCCLCSSVSNQIAALARRVVWW